MRKVKTNAEAYQLFDLLGIKNVSTPRQLKNGTQVFELPIHKMYGPSNKYPLRFATYKSGYVRRCDSSDRIWQLNPKYKREIRWVFLNGTELVTQKFTTWSRAKIWSGMARLKFLHDYAKKNYLNK